SKDIGGWRHGKTGLGFRIGTISTVPASGSFNSIRPGANPSKLPSGERGDTRAAELQRREGLCPPGPELFRPGESELGAQYSRKAYELRDRVAIWRTISSLSTTIKSRESASVVTGARWHAPLGSLTNFWEVLSRHTYRLGRQRSGLVAFTT